MREDRVKFLFLLPCVIWIFSLTIFPLVYSLYLSFQSWHLGKIPSFTGLTNYITALTDYRVHNSLEFTLKFTAVTVSVELLLGLGLALLIHEGIRGERFLRVLFTAPLFTSPIALSYLNLTIFYEEGGPINNILKLLGGPKIPWLSDPFFASLAVMMIDIWQWTPFMFIILLAGLESLPREPYEAAKVDGASSFQIFKHITLPLLTPVIITAVLLKAIESLKVFDLVYALTMGGPGISTETYTMYIYKSGMRFFKLGYAASLSYIFLFIVMILFMLLMPRLRRVYE